MADRRNFLLGRGESLTQQIAPPARKMQKAHPYSFAEALQTAQSQLGSIVSDIESLPTGACPNDEAVVSMTLHPAYLAKSYFPDDLLRKAELRAVGSRSTTIIPRRDLRKKSADEPQVTTRIFVAGKRSTFRSLSGVLPGWREDSPEATDLREVEELAPVTATERMVIDPKLAGDVYEVVLHVPGRYVTNAFAEYVRSLGGIVRSEKSFTVRGLQFVPVRISKAELEALARFTYLRVVRQMPKMRSLLPAVTRVFGPAGATCELPTAPPVANDISVAVFDAGMPTFAELAQYVTVVEPKGIGGVVQNGESHGLAVTSALLFGPLKPGNKAARPYAKVDHYRVLDADAEDDPEVLYDVLHRIDSVLKAKPYDFANISVGPAYPVEDDDVHPWTSVLDERLANGPGRSPGRAKPDAVAFGGTLERPFLVLSNEDPRAVVGICGTSFASPYALRSGIGVRALLGAEQIQPLAIRALLIHRAEDVGHPAEECGWGRVIDDPNQLIVCDPGVVHVVYQGEIAPKQYLRAAIPVPVNLPNVMLDITATICFASETDPQDPLHYTRSGIEVLFVEDTTTLRPNGNRKTQTFFGKDKRFDDEWTLRVDAHKWETIVRRKKRKLRPASTVPSLSFTITLAKRVANRKATARFHMRWWSRSPHQRCPISTTAFSLSTASCSRCVPRCRSGYKLRASFSLAPRSVDVGDAGQPADTVMRRIANPSSDSRRRPSFGNVVPCGDRGDDSDIPAQT
jgi:hypothetical protein